MDNLNSVQLYPTTPTIHLTSVAVLTSLAIPHDNNENEMLINYDTSW